MSQKHLIIGGSGFIGRHVGVLLARGGKDVVMTGRSTPPLELDEAIRARITWLTFDMAEASWDAMLEDVAVVHHYAWTSVPATANADPVGDLASNIVPLIGLLEAMRRRGLEHAPRLVFTSSGGAVYGRLRRVPVQEDHPLSPLGPYGVVKATAELYINSYRDQHGLDCRIARLSNPYGAGQNLAKGQGAATTFLYRALHGLPIVIWGNGEVVRDYIHVSDAAAGLSALACAEGRAAQHIFNVASGEGVSLNAIVEELEGGLGRRLEVIYEPGRSYDVPVSVLDISLGRDFLGWAPKLSFSDGIRRTLMDLNGGNELSTLG